MAAICGEREHREIAVQLLQPVLELPIVVTGIEPHPLAIRVIGILDAKLGQGIAGWPATRQVNINGYKLPE